MSLLRPCIGLLERHLSLASWREVPPLESLKIYQPITLRGSAVLLKAETHHYQHHLSAENSLKTAWMHPAWPPQRLHPAHARDSRRRRSF